MKINIKLNRGGFSVVEDLLALGILLVAVAVAIVLSQNMLKNHSRNQVNSSLEMISSSLLGHISNQDAWDNTRLQNSVMSCVLMTPSQCPAGWEGSISLFDSRRNKILDALNEDQGFRLDGSPCVGYLRGQNQCLIRATLGWKIRCQSVESCKYPQEQFELRFAYKGTDKVDLKKYERISETRLNLSSNQSPQMVCAEKEEIFIGFGQSVKNGDSVSTVADEDGCVPLLAFKGKRGTEGVAGPAGLNSVM